MNTTTVATAVQRRWACHTRTVLPADAYGRQRCNVVLSACSVVYLWCMSWAVCSLERATKTDKNLPAITYKIGLMQRNPGNCLIHSQRKKNFERLPRERQCSDRARTSTNVSGRASRVGVLGVLPKSACTNGYLRKKTNVSQLYIYIYYNLN